MRKAGLAIVLGFTVLLTVNVMAGPGDIKLKTGAIEPGEPEKEVELPDDGGLSFGPLGSTDTETERILIQFDRIPSSQQRKIMENRGIELLQYLPENAWYAKVEGDTVLPEGLKTTRVQKLYPEHKISPDLRRDVAERSRTGDGSVSLKVEFFRDVSTERQRELLEDITRIRSKDGNGIWTVSPGEEETEDIVQEIASENEVRWIRNQDPRRQTLNDDSRQRINVEELHSEPYSLRGEGFTAALWDSGWAGDHSDLNYTGKKVIGDDDSSCQDCTVTEHGTHVAGTMAGNGTMDENLRGIAPDARIATYEWPYTVSELVDDTDDAVTNYNAILSQNSWGWNVDDDPERMGSYDSWSSEYDNMASGSSAEVEDPVLFISSAGNEGDNWDFRYNTTTGPSATAKNSIAVGALDSSGEVAYFSSAGPTDDGRIKPEVMADGWSVNSTVPGNSYDTSFGTSMASPAVSGLATLIQERFNSTHGELASPATVKGILIHTAVEMNRTGPDYLTGWGKVNGTDAISYVDESESRDLLKRGDIGHDENDSFTYYLDGDANITLVWSDPPASSSAEKTLVNDLDLVVRNSTGHRFYPWTLNWSQRDQPATRDRPDRTNPVEKVYIPETEGEIHISVNGTSVPEPRQSYSLLIDRDIEDVPLKIDIESPMNTTYSDPDPDFNMTLNKEATDGFFSVNDGENLSMMNSSATEFYNISTELPDGSHRARFWAESEDETASSEIMFSIDTTAPIITVESPENRTYGRNKIDLNASLTEPAETVNYSVNDGENQSMEQKNSTYFYKNSIYFEDGNHEIKFFSNDSVGNTDSETIRFSVDTEPPEIYPESPLNQSYTTGDIDFNFTSDKELEDGFYSVNGEGNFSMEGSGTFFYNTSHEELPEGRHEAVFWANDTVGNLNSSSVDFEVDTVPPDIDILSPGNRSYNRTDISFELNSSKELEDALIELGDTNHSMKHEHDNIYVNDTVANLSQGGHTAFFYAEDTNGNTNSSSIDFTVDSEKPDITVFSPVNTTYSGDPVDLEYHVNPPVEVNYSLNGDENQTLDSNQTLSLGEGRHLLKLYAEDSFNRSSELQKHFTVDTTPPDLSVNRPEGSNFTDSSFPINLTVIDNFNVSEVTTSVDNSINLTMNRSGRYWTNKSFEFPQGIYNLTFYAMDSAGNVNTTERPIYVDSIPPRFNSVEPDRPLILPNESINLTANITEDNLDSVDIEVKTSEEVFTPDILKGETEDNSSIWLSSFDNTSETGEYRATVKAEDELSNSNNITKSFNISAPAEIRSNITDGSSPVELNWSFIYPDGRKAFESDNSSVNLTLPEGNWLSEMKRTENGDTYRLTMENLETKSFNQTVRWDQNIQDVDSTDHDFLRVFAADIGLNFSSGTAEIPLDSTGSELEAWRCGEWNFTDSECETGWNEVTGDTEFRDGKAEISITGLSSYGITEKEEEAADSGGSGGGGFSGSLAEEEEVDKETRVSVEESRIVLENIYLEDSSESFEPEENRLNITGLELQGDTVENGSVEVRKLDTETDWEQLTALETVKTPNITVLADLELEASSNQSTRELNLYSETGILHEDLNYSLEEKYIVYGLELREGLTGLGYEPRECEIEAFNTDINECRTFSDCNPPQGWEEVEGCEVWEKSQVRESITEVKEEVDTEEGEKLLQEAEQALDEGNLQTAENLIEEAQSSRKTSYTVLTAFIGLSGLLATIVLTVIALKLRKLRQRKRLEKDTASILEKLRNEGLDAGSRRKLENVIELTEEGAYREARKKLDEIEAEKR